MFKLFSKKEENTNDFAAVVSGKIIPLTAVNDDVFSKGMMEPVLPLCLMMM